MIVAVTVGTLALGVVSLIGYGFAARKAVREAGQSYGE